MEKCTLCDYSSTDYVTAKSVVASYYGTVDGKPHTVTVSDLSDRGVSTKIRYGNSADSCTLTSAPNYTDEGQYTVYYEITYTYNNTDMTENGVAYVWLHDETAEDNTCDCGCGEENCGCLDKNCSGSCCGNSCKDNHHFVQIDSIKAGCLTLGYNRYLCTNCGKIEKRDYVNAIDHTWQQIVVREASCELGGSTLHLCSGCGSSFVADYTEPMGHSWDEGSYVTNATCTGDGVMEYRCVRCGYHKLEGDLANGHIPGKAASCTENQVCEVCGAILAVATGHSESDWIVDKEPTLRSEGSRHKECKTCGEILQTESIERLKKYPIFPDSDKYTTQTITHKAYVEGYPDGSFQPNGNVTRAEAAAMLARLLAEDKGDSIWGRMKFRDVASGSWYADYINYLAGYGIAVGCGNYGAEAEQYAFFRIPKVLIKEECFKGISTDAKLLYGLLLDRMSLSVKNGWLDEENRVYIYFTLDEVVEQMGCSKGTAVKLFAALDSVRGVGLIERVKQGQGKPARIYVRRFCGVADEKNPDLQNAEVLNDKNCQSRVAENESQDLQNLVANNTEYIKTEWNNNLSIPNEIDGLRKTIRENISYEILAKKIPKGDMDEMVELVVEVMLAQGETVRIGGRLVLAALARERLSRLNAEHICYVWDCLESSKSEIRNIKAYMQESLFNAPVTMESFYRAMVNWDFSSN